MKRSIIVAAVACWVLTGAIANAEYRIVLIDVKQIEGKTPTVSIRSEDKADLVENVSVDAAIKVIDKMRGWGSAVGVYVAADKGVSRTDQYKILSAVMKNAVLDLEHFGQEIPKDIAARLPVKTPVEKPVPKTDVAKDPADRVLDWDLTKFPKLSGKVTQFIGHELGYVRPRVGESFTLDFGNLAKLQRLDFDVERMSYIPLTGSPLKLEAVNTYTNGAFSSCRLRSQAREHVVNIDIQPKPGRGVPDLVEVWISVESYGMLTGVAVVDCVSDGPFPMNAK